MLQNCKGENAQPGVRRLPGQSWEKLISQMPRLYYLQLPRAEINESMPINSAGGAFWTKIKWFYLSSVTSPLLALVFLFIKYKH